MLKHWIKLPGGEEISSGSEGAAILQLKLTHTVNREEALCLGSACAAMVEVTLLDVEPEQLGYGRELWLYRQMGKKKVCLGCFIAEEPVRKGRLLELTAYDRMVKLDRDITGWLQSLEGWPYTLEQLAQMVCRQCGVSLREQTLPNGTYGVQRFCAEGITGRQLIQWIGEACGRLCRADHEGMLEFFWYAPNEELSVGPVPKGLSLQEYLAGQLYLPEPAVGHWQQEALCLSGVRGEYLQGELTLTGKACQYYLQDGLKLENYAVQPVTRVCIRADEEDVGTAFPPEGSTENTWFLTGNPLLTAADAQTLLPLAESLYEQLKTVTYTPGKLTLPPDTPLEPGQTVRITDNRGAEAVFYAMTLTRSVSRLTAECTGPALRESSAQIANRSLQTLGNRVLRLRADVEGLKLENTDEAGKLTRLEADLEGIRGQVSSRSAQLDHVQEQLTGVSQTAQALQITVQTMETDGVNKVKTAMGYTFDDAGLQIAKDGQQMKNLLDNTGMYVTRSGQTVLQANDAGVKAVDVTVHNYLVIGSHARFEDYNDGTDGKRTACFWVQEA